MLLEMDGATETKESICEAGNLSSSSSFPLSPMASLRYLMFDFSISFNLESRWNLDSIPRPGISRKQAGKVEFDYSFVEAQG